MPTIETEILPKGASKLNQTVLELTVNNHPGVMSQICGLFARRVYNMEGIVCIPVAVDKISKIWIEINSGGQLEQIVHQLHKLEDVHSVRYHETGGEVFYRLKDSFNTL